MDTHNATKACITLTEEIGKMIDEVPTLGTDDVGKSLDAFIAARQLKDTIDGMLKQIGSVVQMYADHHIPMLLERHHLVAAPHRLGMVKMETRYSTTVHDRPGAHEWLRTHGMENLIIETTNAQTLSAVAKGMIQKGEDFPTAHFKTTMRTFAKFVPAGE